MRVLRALVVAAASVSLCVGCAAQPAIDSEISAELQQEVVDLANTAATGDAAAALTQLEALNLQLLEATSRGQVSSERSTQIGAAIELVRQDLQAAVDAVEPEPVQPVEPQDDKKGKDENDEKGKGNENGKGPKGDD
jgi:hypothetical protein